MPVPTVTYASDVAFLHGRYLYSASAAAFTSVSNPIGTPSRSEKYPAMSQFAQPGLGVLVMCPHSGDVLSSSTGPKLAMPRAPRLPWPSNHSAACARVVAGSRVGIVCRAVMSDGERPTARTNFVPPASIAPNSFWPVSVMSNPAWPNCIDHHRCTAAARERAHRRRICSPHAPVLARACPSIHKSRQSLIPTALS